MCITKQSREWKRLFYFHLYKTAKCIIYIQIPVELEWMFLEAVDVMPLCAVPLMTSQYIFIWYDMMWSCRGVPRKWLLKLHSRCYSKGVESLKELKNFKVSKVHRYLHLQLQPSKAVNYIMWVYVHELRTSLIIYFLYLRFIIIVCTLGVIVSIALRRWIDESA